MRAFYSIMNAVPLSRRANFNMKVLDRSGLNLVAKLLAETRRVSGLAEGCSITFGEKMVAFVVKTLQGSTIEIVGDNHGIREIKESWR